MGLVRSKEELTKRKNRFKDGFILSEVKMINVLFTTTVEAIKRVLPPQLEPPEAPLANAYVAEFHRSSFCPPYNEAALFVSAEYKGMTGSYCLSMPVTNDIAMIGGREIYGYPKKIAENIHVKRRGNDVTGICTRRGIDIIKIDAVLSDPFDDEVASSPHFLLKSFADERGIGPDSNPKIVKQHSQITWGPREVGEGRLTLGESIYDPLSDIPVGEVLMALYTEHTEIRMTPGEILEVVDPSNIEPYMHVKYDWDFND
ncbi:MAG: acetoacetate decarboxylase family protein [Candidatus Thorarchaeota archaeon]|jgi:acetoacetate decarboxylase